MADISDVLDLLQTLAVAAVLPNGPGAPSVTGTVVNIAQGWPPSNAVNDAMASGKSLVSIYAVPSTTSKQAVPLATGGEGIVAAPAHGMSGQVTDTGFVLTGEPGDGEYATAIVSGTAYSYTAVPGDLAVGVAASLAAMIAADWPGTVFGQDGSVAIPGHPLIALRIGAAGTMGQIIDRQRQNVMISVWAPNYSDRAVLGRAIDVAVKQNLTVTYPDTTTGILSAQTTNLIDKYQDEQAYRRDLVVQCQWDTLDEYPAYEVTSVGVTLSGSVAPSRTIAY